MKTFRTFLNTMTWGASQSAQPLPIPRGNYLRRLILYVHGVHTLAAGAASGTPRSEPVANIMTSIKVVGDGIGEIKAFDGTGLHLSTKRHNRVNFPVVTSDGAAGAAKPFNATYTIDFALPLDQNIRPADTFLDTRIFSTLQLEIVWSANIKGGMLTGCDRTESAITAVVDVVAEYERPHANFGQPSLYCQYKMSQPVTAASGQYPFKLNVDQVYKEIVMSAQNKAAGADGQFTGNDAMIVDYALKFNTTQSILNRNIFLEQQGLDALDLGLNALHVGANFLRFDTDGMLTEALSTLGGSELGLEMNVALPAGTNEIWLYPGILKNISGASGKVCVPVASNASALIKA